MSDLETKGNPGLAWSRMVRPQLSQPHLTLLASQCIVGLSIWFALLYPLEVSIQKLAQGCPVPPGQQSQPEKECPRRQYNNANEVSVEQDNSGEDSGGCGSQKSSYGAALQEESPQCFINPSH